MPKMEYICPWNEVWAIYIYVAGTSFSAYFLCFENFIFFASFKRFLAKPRPTFRNAETREWLQGKLQVKM